MLNDKFDGNATKAAKVFGNVRGLTGVLSLVGSNAGKNAAIFDRLARSTGDTAEAFKKAKAEDPTIQFKSMVSTVQVAAIKIGNALMPTVIGLANRLSSLAERFSNLSPRAQRMILIAVGLAAAMGPLLYVFGSFARVAGGALRMAGNLGIAFGKNAKAAPMYARAVAGAVKGTGKLIASGARLIASLGRQAAAFAIATGKLIAQTAATIAAKVAQLAIAAAAKVWTAAQWLLNVAMSANPIGLVVLAIAGLVAGIVLAWKKSETFRTVVIAVWNAIKAAASAVWNWLVSAFRKWGPAILTAVAGPVGILVRLVIRNWSQIKAFSAKTWNAIKSAASAAWNAIKAVLSAVWRAIVFLFKTSPAGIIAAHWSKIRSGVSSAWGAITRTLRRLWSGIVDYFRSSISSFLSHRLRDRQRDKAGNHQRLGDVRVLVQGHDRQPDQVGQADPAHRLALAGLRRDRRQRRPGPRGRHEGRRGRWCSARPSGSPTPRSRPRRRPEGSR